MKKKSMIVVLGFITMLGFVAQTGCGPKCAKVITTKSPEDLSYEDGVRINDFVSRRKAAMKEAEGGNMYAVEDAKRTVIACEFAVHMMVRTRNLFEDGNPLYEKNLSDINDTRCFMDDVLLSKGKLIGKGKDAFLSASIANEMRSRYEKFATLFGQEGTLSERAINDVYSKGVKTKKSAAPGKDGEVAPEEEGAADNSAAGEDGDMGAGEGDVEGEEEGGGEPAAGMDSF